jgi:hypothetical protein
MKLRFSSYTLADYIPLVGIACFAFVVRIILIYQFPHGGSDLQIYGYFGNFILRGLNPYQAPLDGPIHPHYADMSPFNLSLFAMVLSIKNSPFALRWFFAIVDLLIMLSIGLFLKRSINWRTAIVLFYGFNPAILMAFVIIAEDKVILFWLLLLIVIFVEYRNALGAVVFTIFLAIYKWMGVLFFVPLCFYFAKQASKQASKQAASHSLF